MSDKSAQAQGGLNLATALFLVFLTLKLTNQIDWSWWWVTSPLWMPVALLVLVAVLVMCYKAIVRK
jgi:hypothetical protein